MNIVEKRTILIDKIIKYAEDEFYCGSIIEVGEAFKKIAYMDIAGLKENLNEIKSYYERTLEDDHYDETSKKKIKDINGTLASIG